MITNTFSFSACTPTYRVSTTTTGSTGVQLVPIRPGIDRINQAYVVNASDGYLFFTLTTADTAAAAPAAGSSAAGYVLPPNSGGTFSCPPDCYFSGDLLTGTGDAYVCGGVGL